MRRARQSQSQRRPWQPTRSGLMLFLPALVLFCCLSFFIASQPRAARKIVAERQRVVNEAHEVGASDEAAAIEPAIHAEIEEGRRQKMQQAKATGEQAMPATTPAVVVKEEGDDDFVVLSKTPTRVPISQDSWTEGWSMRHSSHPPVAWPLFRVGQDMLKPGDAKKHNQWPGAGYRANTFPNDGLDETFDRVFRFYLLEEDMLDMRNAEKCLRENRGMPEGDSWEGIDTKLKIGEREHLTELFLLRALRTHPLRTKNRDEAHLFIIGYAPGLARISLPCPSYAKGIQEWEEDVADVLLADESFNKKGGRDFLFLHSGREWELFNREQMNADEDLPPQLADVLNGGPIIATSERYSPSMQRGLPMLFERGSIVITPHVSSEAIDLHITANEPPIQEDERDGPRFYFRGNMESWHGDRAHMLELASLLEGADFQEYDFQKHTAEETAPLLKKAAEDMRKAGLCFSPEGNSPASARLFEALGTGCVPIVVSHRHRISFDLPFPSLVDYDAIAIFSEPFRDIAKKVGGGMAALSATLENLLHDQLTQRMRHDGFKAFKKYFSYMNNPEGVVRGLLMEAWVLLMRHNIVSDIYI